MLQCKYACIKLLEKLKECIDFGDKYTSMELQNCKSSVWNAVYKKSERKESAKVKLGSI